MKRNLKVCISGFSIVEVLIASAILGAVALIVSTQTSQFSNFFVKTRKAVEQNFDSMISYKMLMRDLETSYFMKLGYLNCSNSNNVMATLGTDIFQMTSALSEFDLIGVDFTSVAGLSEDGKQINVSDVGTLKLGDYIVMSLAGDTRFASLFAIKEINIATRSLKLTPTKFTAKGFNCTDSFVSRAKIDFFGPSIRSNVLVSRIRPTKLKLEESNLRRVVHGNTETSQILFSNVSKFEIRSIWRNFSSSSSDLLEGSMEFQVNVNFLSQEIVRNVSSRSGTQTFNARYILDSVSAANAYAVTGAPASTVVFPSCSISHEFRNNIMRIHPRNNWWRNMTTLVLRGQVSSSSVVGANITVSLFPQVGAAVSCFLHDPDTLGPYPGAASLVEFPGEKGLITLTQKAGGFDIYTCAVRGNVVVQANMSYFDTQIHQIKNIECSADPIRASTQFIFESRWRPSCDQDLSRGGAVDVEIRGRIKGFDADSSFRQFSFDTTTGCEWLDDRDNRESGIASNCSLSRGKKLRRIYLRPYRVDVLNEGSQTSFFTKAEGAYVDCRD